MTNTHTIDLSSDSGEILASLEKLASKSKEQELKNIKLHSDKIKKEKPRKDDADLKKNKRRIILDRWEEIESKRRESLKNAMLNKEEANKKFQLRSSKSTISQSAIRESERLLRNAMRNLDDLSKGSTREVLERKVKILEVGRNYINTDIPITMKAPNSGDKEIRWQTNDVYIRETSGEFLDFNFGKFDVTVKTENRCNATTLTVSCEQVGEREEKNNRKRHGGYPHPHVNYDTKGTPCLGRALDSQLMERMKVMDVTGVIVLMSEFLSSYNGNRTNNDVPYAQLSHWVPNRSDCPICSCCDLLREVCSCDVCNDCLGDFEDKNMSECGSCHTCCMKLHMYIDSEKLEPGLNGTNCYPK